MKEKSLSIGPAVAALPRAAAMALSLALASLAHAQQPAAEGAAHEAHHAPSAPGPAASQSEGEVRKVDLAQGKVTLRHGPLVDLDMPAMTMVFTAAEPRLLDGLRAGDKVRFTAAKRDGVLFVTAIEVVH